VKKSALGFLRSDAGIPARTMVAATIAALLGSATASAQSADTATLDEIVVTARFRAENLQQTPLAITAISADALEAQGITSVQNLSAVVPNTYIAAGAAGAVGSPTISMRGVAQTDFMFSFEAPVGVYIDDVYRPHMLGSDLELLDIDHIEVLRGPQGTLFGKNSMGGALRLFSKKPQGNDSGFVEASAGNLGAYNFRGSFDTAVIPDRLFMRVSGAYKHIDGYVDVVDFACQMRANGTPNLIPAGVQSWWPYGGDCRTGTQGEENVKAGRVMMRLVVNDKSEILVSLDKTDVDGTGTPDLTLAAISQQDAIAQQFIPPGGTWDSRYLAPDRHTSYASTDTPNVNMLHEWGLSVTGTLDFSEHARAKVVYGHRDYRAASSFNADASPLRLIQNWNPIHHTQDSAELQITGEALDGKLQWTTGAYYFKGDTDLGGHIKYVFLNFDQDDSFPDKNESAFLHGVFNATGQLSFTGGLRYSKNQKIFQYHHPGIGADPTQTVCPGGADPTCRFEFKDSRTDWMVGANFKFTPDTMGYATVSTGYRPGGVNPRPIIVPDQLTSNGQFDGEEMISYEVGLKSEMLDHRLRANLAVFYSDYKSYLSQGTFKQCIGHNPIEPIPSANPCPPDTLVIGGNAIAAPWFAYFTQPAKVKGIEAEFLAEPVAGLRLNASLGYNEFKSGITDPGSPLYRHPANLLQPRWNVAAGMQYALAVTRGTLTPRLDWNYTSKATANGSPNSLFDPRFGLTGSAAYDLTAVPSHSLLNARLGYDTEDGKWSAALRVENLFDNDYWLNKFDASGLVVSGIPNRPRTWLLSVQRNFN
jgi:iron complex outermembrane recepter protein